MSDKPVCCHVSQMHPCSFRADCPLHELAALRWWIADSLHDCGEDDIDGDEGYYAAHEEHYVHGCTQVAAIVALYDKVVGR